MLRAAAVVLLLPLAAAAEMFPEVPFSDDARGTTGAAFLKTTVGARAQSLGEAYAAVPGDADSLFWNPAGLAEVGRREMSASYGSLLETAYTSAFSLAAPVGRSVFAFGALFHGQSAIDAYDAVGDRTGDFQPYDLALSAAWAKPVGMSSVGLAAKGIRQRLADRTALGLAFDGGIQWRNVGFLEDGPIDMGFAFQNLGGPIKLGTKADPLPFRMALGWRWRARTRLTMLLDTHLPVDRSPYLSGGVEGRIPAGASTLAVRAGYSFAQYGDLDGLAGLTAGLGLAAAGWRVDVAWLPMGELGHTHRATLAFRF